MKQILEIDGPMSASRVVQQYDEILTETATSINTDIRNGLFIQCNSALCQSLIPWRKCPHTDDGISGFSGHSWWNSVQFSTECCLPNLLLVIPSHDNYGWTQCGASHNYNAFIILEPSTSSTLSSLSSSASVLPSLYTTTSSSQPRPASSSNVPTSPALQDHLPYSLSHQQSPSSVIDHHPPVSVSLQFQQNSLPCSTVSSNASCTVSPSFYSSSPLLSSTLSGQPPTSFCGQPALSSSCAISVFPASSTSLSHLCTHTSYTIIFPTSFIVCKWASASFFVCLHTSCQQFFTHCLSTSPSIFSCSSLSSVTSLPTIFLKYICHGLLQPLTSLHPDKVQCHHPALLW